MRKKIFVDRRLAAIAIFAVTYSTIGIYLLVRVSSNVGLTFLGVGAAIDLIATLWVSVNWNRSKRSASTDTDG